jgi:hypothetical protein
MADRTPAGTPAFPTTAETQVTVPQSALATQVRALLDQPEVRAVLVSDGHEPETAIVRTVSRDASVLNIGRELKDHLDDGYFPDEWLAQLRDYCIGRLAARAEARSAGAVSIPRGWGWEIRHIECFDPVLPADDGERR